MFLHSSHMRKRGGQMPSLYVWQAHGDGRGALEQGPFVCV